MAWDFEEWARVWQDHDAAPADDARTISESASEAVLVHAADVEAVVWDDQAVELRIQLRNGSTKTISCGCNSVNTAALVVALLNLAESGQDTPPGYQARGGQDG